MDYAFREFLETVPRDERADTERLLLAYNRESKSTAIGYLWFYFFFPIGDIGSTSDSRAGAAHPSRVLLDGRVVGVP